MSTYSFENRHSFKAEEIEHQNMLEAIDCITTDDLIEQTVPQSIYNGEKLDLPKALTESEYLEHMQKLAHQNNSGTSFLGMGYYNTIVPPVVQRNIFENPGWYTAYTPYQAEIAQGRLEMLLNFQTMITDLTNLPLANASLLDEATAAAEAMAMLHRSRPRNKKDANTMLVDAKIFPQTKAVLQTRAEPLGIKIEIVPIDKMQPAEDVFAIILQVPNREGLLQSPKELLSQFNEQSIPSVIATDILSLCINDAPGNWGAHVCVGSSQRFGVPMGYGGPHAAFLATKEEYRRQVPGRIIGVSVDRHGNQAYRMSLQTREQHIRREQATSNICTAQSLLAIMASAYAIVHGGEGLAQIALTVHRNTKAVGQLLTDLGFEIKHSNYFDTLCVKLSPDETTRLKKICKEGNIHLWFESTGQVQFSFDETTGENEINQLLKSFCQLADSKELTLNELPEVKAERSVEYLQHPVFRKYKTETQLMRYFKKLEDKDLALNRAMIPLGSCTMKLNAAAEMMPLSWTSFANLHPFLPVEAVPGIQSIIEKLGSYLCTITGFQAISLQPNAGSQGEYAGLLSIRNYHRSKGEKRDIALIPTSAHGTNPASAVMAGFTVVTVNCDVHGNIDVKHLKERIEQYEGQIGALMVTYPSTHGVFEPGIKDLCQLIHDAGGMVYMDGANMNAQVGLSKPGQFGVDVCHLNLHKTFGIPHGGGGPGMGPICVNSALKPFLPSHPVISTGMPAENGTVSATPWGSALILLISYGYIRLLGPEGLRQSTKQAILNANYLAARLEQHYSVLYTGVNGRVAHELILDCRPFKKTAGIEVEDIAKRLIDFGFHAPTMSWPVIGTMMIEPTESEDKEELDRFLEAMITIREEIREIENGDADAADNVLKNAPHTQQAVTANDWQHAYDREKAAYPVAGLRSWKFWPSVARVDNAYGDRNLVCTCPPLEAYN